MDLINFFEKIPKKKTDIVFFDIDDKNNLLITSNWRSDSISIIDLAKQEYLYEIKTGKQSRSFGQFIKID